MNKPWLASYDPNVPAHMEYEDGPLFDLLDRSAAEHPQRAAVVFRNLRLRYKGLLARSEALAAGLKDRGLAKGDRVALMAPNLPSTIIAYWGILKAGGVAVMVSPLYLEHELLHILNDSGPRFMILLDLLWPKVEPLRDRIPVERWLCCSIPDDLRFPMGSLARMRLKREGRLPDIPYGRDVERMKKLARGRKRYSCPDIEPGGDTAVLQYTGGTTGLPKGCMLTHRNLSANTQQCRAMLHAIGHQPEVFLGILPYFHVYGLTVCLNFPTSLAAAMAPTPRFAPSELVETIQRVRPTIFPGAPSIYTAIMQQKGFEEMDFSYLRYCVSGSAPLPDGVMRRFEKTAGATIIEGYGLTEASPVTHLNPLSGKRKTGSIGLPFPDTDARVVDPLQGMDPLPPGEAGELAIKGPQVMKGYWRQPEATAEVLRDGWLLTGDVARMDEEGYFFILDRKKDMIITGGFNVYPREVEEVIYGHDKVEEAVVVGLEHEGRGEVVKAFVVPRPGCEVSGAEIRSHCRKRLASYKVPREVEVRSELPKSHVGKLLRRVLRDEARSGGAEEG
ncbi:MAG: long-chain-fatty-acid--CoA ligase [Desulfovibrionaceae bacterium]